MNGEDKRILQTLTDTHIIVWIRHVEIVGVKTGMSQSINKHTVTMFSCSFTVPQA